MLKGSNTLMLNFASTGEAIEEYLNRRLAADAQIKVNSISAQTCELKVSISAKEAEPPKEPEPKAQAWTPPS